MVDLQVPIPLGCQHFMSVHWALGTVLLHMMHVYGFVFMHGLEVVWKLQCFWRMSVLCYGKLLVCNRSYYNQRRT
nr:hypothetical protein Iba_chr14cCG11140 [Ipomoea batatas]